MRRLIVLTWLLGCSADGTGDDDPPLRPPPPAASQDDDDGQGGDAPADREECELAMLTGKCPAGWGWFYHPGPGDPHDDGLIDLAALGEPVCHGRGMYADFQSIEGIEGQPRVALTTVDNAECYAVCFPPCSLVAAELVGRGVCWAEGPDGQHCAHVCDGEGLTREECAAFVAECLGEDAAACDEDPPR